MMVKNKLRHNITSILMSLKIKTAALTVSSVILLTWASPVSAGFEWKAPVPVPPPVVVEKQPVVPPPQKSILWKENISEMPVQRIQGVESVPIIVTDRIMPERIVPERIVPKKAVSDRIVPYSTASTIPDGIISGFGTELPLEIALQQIIPPMYKFSFAPGVNPTTIVSWRGERPWKKVLTDMLSKRNLGFSHQNNVITISTLPTLYPPVSMPSSSEMIKNTAVNKADMIPTDMIFNDRMKRTKLPTSSPSLSSTKSSAVTIAPLGAPAPLTSIPRTLSPSKTKKNKAVEAKKSKTITIRREKPKTPLIRRILRLTNNKDKIQHKVALPQEKIAKAAPPVNRTTKRIPDISISQKMNNISPANAAPDSKKVDLATYYRKEQDFKNKKADMIPTDMISNNVVETPTATTMHAERPAPLTVKIPNTGISKYQKASTTSKPEIKIAKAKITNKVTPNVSKSSWHATGGQTLRTILSDWSRIANVELHWDIDYDYRLNEDIVYKGNFNNAVEKLLDKYTKVRPQPYGRLIQKNSGDNILIVNSYDFSY